MSPQLFFRKNLFRCVGFSMALCLGLPTLTRADILRDHYTIKTSKGIQGFREVLTGCAARAKDGGMVVAGNEIYPRQGIILVKVDSLGEEQWRRDYPATAVDNVWELKPAPDGGFVFTGNSYASFPGFSIPQAFIQKVDSLGNLEWRRILTSANRSIDSARSSHGWAIEPSRDGGFLVAGYSDQIGSDFRNDALIFKVDSQGAILWNRIVGGPHNDEFRDIRELADGNLILVGTNYQNRGEAWMYKTDSQGQQLFSRIFPTEDYNHAYKVDLTQDGGVFVSTTRALVKTDALGNPIWLRLSPPPEHGKYVAMETPEGTHFAWGNSGSDIFGIDGTRSIIAGLDSTGQTQWTHSFGVGKTVEVLPAPEGAYDIVTSAGPNSARIIRIIPNLRIKDSLSARPGTWASLSFAIHNPTGNPMRYEFVGKIRRPDGTWIPIAPDVFLNHMNLTVNPGETSGAEFSHRIPDDAVPGTRYLYHARLQNRATDHPILRTVTVDIE
jgi:hypothetical protein